jgi:hypothetical protein
LANAASQHVNGKQDSQLLGDDTKSLEIDVPAILEKNVGFENTQSSQGFARQGTLTMDDSGRNMSLEFL